MRAMSKMSARIMLNHRIRSLLFHYKKKLLQFAIGFYFCGKSIQKHPDSVCENDVNKCSRVLYVKSLNERLIILLSAKKKNVILASIFW